VATLDIAALVEEAEERIRPYVRETPLDPSPALAAATGCSCWVKLENLQHTGSFKLRGAISGMLSLDPEQIDRGVIAASTGNHGAAVAFAARKLGARATIYVPETASPSKVEAVRRLGAEILFVGEDGVEAERHARAQSEASGRTYLSPYNDPVVIGGQGTVGLEIGRQLESLDALYVSVGGGGLISGIAGYLKAVRPGLRVVGCSPERSAAMHASVNAGRIVEIESEPTLSDGTAGGLEHGAITLEPCRELVDEWVDVSEEAIAHAMRLFMEAHHQMIEGSAGVAIAGFLERSGYGADENAVVVICGGNISLPTLRAVLGDE
jgi:threonine dehydratase